MDTLMDPIWIHPGWDPVAIAIGPLAVRWYGLMYLLGFVGFILLSRWRARHQPHCQGWDGGMIEGLVLYGILGVILGGRLGYVLFYTPGYYLSHPENILAIWRGGMSFHGGLLGVIIALFFYARSHNISFWQVTDFVAPVAPLGLFFGRIGNFINGELWGRPTHGHWGVIFPHSGDSLPRYPSQLYQAGLEGLLLFILLWLYARYPRAPGRVSAAFLLGYGSFRFIAEYFREPDRFLGLLGWEWSMGQWLSLPMIILGAGLLCWRCDKPHQPIISTTTER